MSNIELASANGKYKAYACEHCRVVIAHDFVCPCQPTPCVKCGTTIEPRSYCKACHAKSEAEREETHFAAATKVPESEYDGMVYDYRNDEFYPNVDCFRDICEDEGNALPEFVWATKPQRMNMRADELIDSELEDAGIDLDTVDGVPEEAYAELQSFLDQWCAKYSPTWQVADYKRAVVLNKDEP